MPPREILARHRLKRIGFSRVQENGLCSDGGPAGNLAEAGKGARFVIRKHDAIRSLDLTREDGVLKSWAVPKGSRGKRERTLAGSRGPSVEYASFEGILRRPYGGGLSWCGTGATITLSEDR